MVLCKQNKNSNNKGNYTVLCVKWKTLFSFSIFFSLHILWIDRRTLKKKKKLGFMFMSETIKKGSMARVHKAYVHFKRCRCKIRRSWNLMWIWREGKKTKMKENVIFRQLLSIVHLSWVRNRNFWTHSLLLATFYMTHTHTHTSNIHCNLLVVMQFFL